MLFSNENIHVRCQKFLSEIIQNLSMLWITAFVKNTHHQYTIVLRVLKLSTCVIKMFFKVSFYFSLKLLFYFSIHKLGWSLRKVRQALILFEWTPNIQQKVLKASKCFRWLFLNRFLIYKVFTIIVTLHHHINIAYKIIILSNKLN